MYILVNRFPTYIPLKKQYIIGQQCHRFKNLINKRGLIGQIINNKGDVNLRIGYNIKSS